MRILNRIYNPINVEYMGVFMPIPPDVKFLATDSDGTLYGYVFKPFLVSLKNPIVWDSNEDNIIKLATVDLEGKDWRESMVAI